MTQHSGNSLVSIAREPSVQPSRQIIISSGFGSSLRSCPQVRRRSSQRLYDVITTAAVLRVIGLRRSERPKRRDQAITVAIPCVFSGTFPRGACHFVAQRAVLDD